MGELDKKEGMLNVSRRDFLKTGAAIGAGVAAGTEFFAAPSMAAAAAVADTFHTTCPYCSASCGQLVDVDSAGNVLDVYGDHRSPFNDGGLCAKGAGAYQLVTNSRRIGAWTGTHPVDSVFAADGTTNGKAYKRVADASGGGAWTAMDVQAAFEEIAPLLVTARGTFSDASGNLNSKGVAFFGSSHMNNEQNYTYRKIIANFGTSNTEHQARI